MKQSEITDYVLSLPERVVRSAAAVTAGLVRELGDAAVPPPIRRGRLYQSLVDSTLRFLIEQVGQVEGAYPVEGRLAEDFALRRTAGNGLELIGVLTFRASPVWVMAALADLSGASRRLVREICDSLKQEGLLDPRAEFTNVDQMLDGLERWSGRVAEAINTPPLDVNELRREWAEIRREAVRLPPSALPSPELLRASWEGLKTEAEMQGRSVFQVSSVLALSAVSRLPANLLRLARSAQVASASTGRLLASSLLDHYSNTLEEIHNIGFAQYFEREMRPYLRAAAGQLSPLRTSLTQKFLRRGL